MGCVSGRDCQDDEQPVHHVEVASFALGVYEVTIAEYDLFADATGWHRPNHLPGTTSRHPVDFVSWEDAAAYAAWLSSETGEQYRLPSESEWEYAARAGTTTRWYWGDDPTAQYAYANGADLTLLAEHHSSFRRVGRAVHRWGVSPPLARWQVFRQQVRAARHVGQRGRMGGGLLARELCASTA